MKLTDTFLRGVKATGKVMPRAKNRAQKRDNSPPDLLHNA
jgi:hypothetical protein